MIEQLKQLVHEQFGVDPSTIDPDAPFADYDLDSLTVAELVFSIEDKFKVEVPDTAVTQISNMRGMAVMLDGLLASEKA